MKIIYELPWKTSTRPYMKELHWLPVRERITYKIGLLTYKCKYNLAPSYLSVLIKNYAPTRQLRSTSANLLVEPGGVISEAASKAFSVAGPAVWNKFEDAIRNSSTLASFKTKLKASLFKVAYNTIWTFFRLFHLTAFLFYFYFAVCNFLYFNSKLFAILASEYLLMQNLWRIRNKYLSIYLSTLVCYKFLRIRPLSLIDPEPVSFGGMDPM